MEVYGVRTWCVTFLTSQSSEYPTSVTSHHVQVSYQDADSGELQHRVVRDDDVLQAQDGDR